MILNEIYEKSPAAYQDLSQDNSQLKLVRQQYAPPPVAPGL